jgi:ABC-type enterochelin transport system ATPase subunit
MTADVLQIEALQKRIGDVLVLSDISTSLKEGHVTAFIVG